MLKHEDQQKKTVRFDDKVQYLPTISNVPVVSNTPDTNPDKNKETKELNKLQQALLTEKQKVSKLLTLIKPINVLILAVEAGQKSSAYTLEDAYNIFDAITTIRNTLS